jgi:hypothetical protein
VLLYKQTNKQIAKEELKQSGKRGKLGLLIAAILQIYLSVLASCLISEV